MPENRPRGREKKVTQSRTGGHRRGSGTGQGPVGSPNGYSGKGSGGKSGGGITRAGGLSLPVIILAVIAYFLFGGGGGGTSTVSSTGQSNNYGQSSYTSQGAASGGYSSTSGQTVNTWVDSTGTSETLNTSVSSGAREKYTKLLGSGKDTVTLMVYMCGTDLESRSGMATNDLQEMAAATLGDKINLLVYTGGCKRWNNNIIDNNVNQIYQITSNGMRRLVSNDGKKAMTDPSTLSAYIKWCKANYPATRYGLILWDHGGGSISGYGYDEKISSSASMDLAGINKALKDGGTQFDFIGFDACLMATAETALMLDPYADYLIASEETEPGIGWYYTNWLTDLGRNTSIATTSLGKEIVDDFVSTCASKCRGQQTTLSVIDLAEFADTIPDKLSSFSESVSTLISNNNFKTVSNARYSTREFAASTRIDQVDLAHLALNMGTSEGKALTEAIRSAVKYNRTSTNMTNAYGVSIYFPYRRSTYVDKVCNTYSQIGMNSSYAKCIQDFAALSSSGQVATGGSNGSFSSLFDSLGGYSSGYTTGSSSSYSGSQDEISALLNAFLGGGYGSISGLTGSNTGYLSGRSMSTEDTVEYISDNFFGSASLVWNENSDGGYTMSLSEDQWSLVHELDLNMFYDDGQGYVDLGLDNIYSFDENGSLVADTARDWLAINGQPVAYYHIDTIDDGENYTITGRVPAMLNGERVELILVFDNDNPYGFVAGASKQYNEETETMTVAKNLVEINKGDKIDFLCDFYSYSGEFQDSYYLGEQMTVDGDLEISNVDIGEGDAVITYRFTDIYNQEYWSDSIRIAK